MTGRRDRLCVRQEKTNGNRTASTTHTRLAGGEAVEDGVRKAFGIMGSARWPRTSRSVGSRRHRDYRAARLPAQPRLHHLPGIFFQHATQRGRLRLDDEAGDRSADGSSNKKARRPQGPESVMRMSSAKRGAGLAKVRKSGRASKHQTVRKKSTGIVGFDQITNGGLPEGRVTAVIGGPGMGKSFFGLQFLLHRLRTAGDAGLFVTFEQSQGRRQVRKGRAEGDGRQGRAQDRDQEGVKAGCAAAGGSARRRAGFRRGGTPMYKHILISTDGSELAQKAEAAALEWQRSWAPASPPSP